MTLSLPADVKALLRNGFNRSVELNSNILGQELRRQRDGASDWTDRLGGAGGLKSMTLFQLSVRLLGLLHELDASERKINHHMTFHVVKSNY